MFRSGSGCVNRYSALYVFAAPHEREREKEGALLACGHQRQSGLDVNTLVGLAGGKTTNNQTVNYFFRDRKGLDYRLEWIIHSLDRLSHPVLCKRSCWSTTCHSWARTASEVGDMAAINQSIAPPNSRRKHAR